MSLTKERAALLDKILTTATPQNRIVELPFDKVSNKNEYVSAGQDLANNGLGKHLAEGSFMVSPDGLSLSANRVLLNSIIRK